MKMEKHMEIILREMCARVGANYNNIDFLGRSWFMLYEWTKTQENDFTKWVGNYLYNNKEARAGLLSHPTKNKTRCKRAASEFVWNHGWKISQP